MALTPKERADFDDIVLRLRLEDAESGVIHTRRRPFALMVSVLAATLVFGLGVMLLGHGILGPVLITLVLLGGLAAAVWHSARSGPRRQIRRHPRRP